MDITQLLAFTMQNNASDLHLSPNNPPIIRAHGDLKRIKSDPLRSDDIRTMLYSVMTKTSEPISNAIWSWTSRSPSVRRPVSV